jgi:hypothetical protein
MDKEAFEKYLKERYSTEIAWYDKKAKYNKNMFQGLQVIVTVFSVLISVVLALSEQLRAVAIVFSAIVAIGATLMRSFTYQETWINYRTVTETLRKEINYYHARLGEYHNAEDHEAFFVGRVENLISRENTMWETCQKSTKDPSPANA